MLLRNKNAVIYGGGGAIGGAVARAFAREERRSSSPGALWPGSTRWPRRLPRPEAWRRPHKWMPSTAGPSTNTPMRLRPRRGASTSRSMPSASFTCRVRPSRSCPSRTTLIRSRPTRERTSSRRQAVARHMAKRGSGVILTLSTPGARMTGQGFLGNGVASAAIEAFSRILAGELGARGIRVVCLRPDAIPEAVATSHTRAVFSGFAERGGTTDRGHAGGSGAYRYVAETASDTCRRRELRGLRGLGSGRRNDRRHRKPDVWLARGLARAPCLPL